MQRISSGNEDLDAVLGGGFPANSVNVIIGLPGTGKTILAENIVFHNASDAHPALYMSTVSEPLDKMIRYGQEFDFFDASKVGESVFYEDLSEALRSGGVPGAIERVIETLKEYRPTFLVIDSFKAFSAFAESEREYRSELSQLSAVLTALSCTTFLVGEYGADDISRFPEFAVADSIIEIVLQKVGVRDIRYLRVLKERGSDFRAGEHAIKITAEGLKVFPRLITPPTPTEYETGAARVSTGIDTLDGMTGGGVFEGSSTAVFGPPGSGKTLLGLHFVFAALSRGERCLIATTEENPTELARIASGFGWDLGKAIDDGLLILHYVSPVGLYVDEFVSDIVGLAQRHGVRRLLVDSLNDLQASSPDPNRFRDYMYAFVQLMAGSRITTILTQELADLFSTTVLSKYGISHMSDNVVLLTYVPGMSEIRRAISVVKTRASDHDPLVYRFTVTSDGIRIGEVFPEADLQAP